MASPASFRVTLRPDGRSFAARSDETILQAAQEAGLTLPHGCRNGACGACKARVVAGRLDHGATAAQGLSDAEREAGFALLCCARPLSDIDVECREAGDAHDVPVKVLPCRVQKIERVADDIVILSLRLPASERLRFLAGQYVEFLLKDGRRRAFSIANAPHEEGDLQLHIRRVPGGQFTGHVFDAMKEKDILRIEGPRGSFYLREESGRPLILLAGGTGFAPIKALVEHALHRGTTRPMHIYRGARDRAGLYLPELAPAWAREHPGVRYVPVLSEEAWEGRRGLVHRAVLEDHSDLSAFQVYACGAPAMIDAARADFAAAGLPADEFFADAFSFSAT